MYEVSIDRAKQLMTVRVSGFWTREVFKAYAAEAARHADVLRRGGGFRSLLIDMSDFPLQAAAIADLHGQLLIATQQRYGVNAAVVMRSALSRLQAARVAKLTGNDLFDDADTALAALMERAGHGSDGARA